MIKKKIVLMILFISLFLVLAGYFLLAFYYRTGFGPSTWINGVYCTGKSVEEVNSELLSYDKAPIVVITDKYDHAFTLDFTQIDYSCDYMAPLKRHLEKQNPYLWINDMMSIREYTLTPAVSYEEKELRKLWEELPFVRKEEQREEAYEIRWSEEEGFYLYDGLTGRLDTEKAYSCLVELLAEGGTSLDLEEAGCYYDISMPADREELDLLCHRVEIFQKCDIVYDMGAEQIPFTPAVMSGFLKQDERGMIETDAAGNPVLDEDAVKEFVDNLAEEYDTYGREREFQSTRGDIVTIKGGTYGTVLDRKAEVDFLLENLLSADVRNGMPMEHVPVYEREGVVRGKDDIGSTYIEVDMTQQKMYYYSEGELMLETDIVTGNTGRRMGTPEGVNFVYGKQKNRVLRGPGYASPVKYWMPVNGNIGIHDARWRSEFGGTIYQKNGSHGCINTPLEQMEELYDMVEVGTPVVMFY